MRKADLNLRLFAGLQITAMLFPRNRASEGRLTQAFEAIEIIDNAGSGFAEEVVDYLRGHTLVRVG